jgi:GT2 family glycosyltransferase
MSNQPTLRATSQSSVPTSQSAAPDAVPMTMEPNRSGDVVPSHEPKVSIIILNWNSYDVTKECLSSIYRMSYRNYQIVLVDNGSADGSADRLAEEFPSILAIYNERNLGFTGGNNIGIKRAFQNQPDYILLLNNDTIVEPEFLSKLIAVAESDEQIGILNPKIYYFDQPKRLWYAGGSFNLWKGVASHHGHRKIDRSTSEKIKEVDFITGCAFLIRSAVVRQVGLLDDILFYSYEDADWSIRVRHLGYKAVYVPAAQIWHKESYDTKKNAGKAFRDYYNVRNSILVMRKHGRAYHWPSFLICLSCLLGYRTAGYAVRGEKDRIHALFSGLREGFTAKVQKGALENGKTKTPLTQEPTSAVGKAHENSLQDSGGN